MSARLVVVGDALLDVDVEAEVTRFVPDTAAPVLEETGRTVRGGGAALAARLAARAAGAEVVLVAAVADDPAGHQLRAALGSGVRLLELPARGRTAVKTRLRHTGRPVARLDQGGAELCPTDWPAQVRAAVLGADAVLVSDYGRGVTRAPAVRDALGEAARSGVLMWDPHPRGGAPVPGAALVTPNADEAAHALDAARADGVAEACRQARELVTLWQARTVAVTLGGTGAVFAAGPHSAAAVPAGSVVDGDACGAGDCFAAHAALALTHGALASEAVAAGVDAATRFIAAGGVDSLTAASPGASSAAVSSDSSEGVEPSGVLVATGGCFDLLHAGHVATLDAARALGDRLVVLVNSDESVRRRKGADRPVQSLADRVRVLRGLRSVDEVRVFDDDTPMRALAELRPDIWVKGGDYAGTELPETATVRSWGGEVVTVPYLPGRSTTRLIDRARS